MRAESRIKSVRAESRIKSIRAESRIKSVRAESRIKSRRAESRIKSVRAESRIKSIRAESRIQIPNIRVKGSQSCVNIVHFCNVQRHGLKIFLSNLVALVSAFFSKVNAFLASHYYTVNNI
jgi:hypothetical protein